MAVGLAIVGSAASMPLTGFLLTAVPNWTGRMPLQGRPLLVLVLAWAAGRLAVTTSAWIGWEAAAVIDNAFLVLVAAAMGQEIIRGKNWRNLKVLIALGVLTEARTRGIRVPEQVAVVGLGDLDFAAATDPALTTVRIDGTAIGREAANRVRVRTSQKGKALFHPIRVVLTGRAEGPELDLAVPAIDLGAELPPPAGIPKIIGNRERAAAFERALEERLP